MSAAPGRAPDRKPVLIVLHQELSTPGRVGRLLQERGHPLDVRRPRYGDPLPPTLAAHAGAVIFGGPMSANDPDAFLRREIDWIAVPLAERKPYLGLCLGAQMLAKCCGASVQAHPEGRAEIGYYPLVPTEAGRGFAREIGQAWPSHVYHWHREGFTCPAGAEMLATGDDFPTQAIRVGPAAFGLQFHPEVTHAMLCRWTVRAAERLALPGAQDRVRQIEGRYMHDPQVARWLDCFLDHWLALGNGASSA
ncbi:glutamine amidotransferase class-I [Methylobacterium sp. 4-46]|uniref:glutamine amidotransferase n=1 Tax=unclassified Methylobacterium TaxID=2615210 RepID=UPI000165C9B4|nr:MULTISPECIES: glutamine amidotransferase [Methylobacterium]ACA16338.1 glutamine amidotransferase class-I [Methylobacterium sp. 4-46]WFT82045.1 glutamine amidotransferase [Methylobacterium nodulans]